MQSNTLVLSTTSSPAPSLEELSLRDSVSSTSSLSPIRSRKCDQLVHRHCFDQRHTICRLKYIYSAKLRTNFCCQTNAKLVILLPILVCRDINTNLSKIYVVTDNSRGFGVLGYTEIEIHLDINPNKEHNSSLVVQQAVGYIKGVCMVEPKVKPLAFAASAAADRYKSLAA